jgi:hypothetical protein
VPTFFAQARFFRAIFAASAWYLTAGTLPAALKSLVTPLPLYDLLKPHVANVLVCDPNSSDRSPSQVAYTESAPIAGDQGLHVLLRIPPLNP